MEASNNVDPLDMASVCCLKIMELCQPSANAADEERADQEINRHMDDMEANVPNTMILN